MRFARKEMCPHFFLKKNAHLCGPALVGKALLCWKRVMIQPFHQGLVCGGPREGILRRMYMRINEARQEYLAWRAFCVSICTFVPVKQVN
jgi:hypothetical protein